MTADAAVRQQASVLITDVLVKELRERRRALETEATPYEAKVQYGRTMARIVFELRCRLSEMEGFGLPGTAKVAAECDAADQAMQPFLRNQPQPVHV